MHRFRLLFVMDPYSTLNLATETSLLLIDELLARGHAVDWVELDGISLVGDRLRIESRAVRSVTPFELQPTRIDDGAAFDAVVIRKDPPFDSRYLHLTQLLDRLPPQVLQVNPAQALRDFNEKLAAMRFQPHTPASIVTLSLTQLQRFVAEHGEAVIKPLDDCSGRGICFVRDDQADRDEVLAAMLRDRHGEPRYLQAQVYLPAIAAGDKRVYLLDGEPVGIVNRVPAAGSRLGNIHQGARVEAAELTLSEQACVRSLQPWLRDHGLLLVGADFIGGQLTELNITSPSALRQINAVSGRRVEQQIVELLVQRLDERFDSRTALG